MQSAQKNAHRKYRGLLRRRANYFLAAGPAGLARLFEVDYGHDGIVRLNEAPHERLRYTNQ
jgi:hypothetical protein